MTKKTTGFTCGSFDCTHAGHYLMFEECKNQCDHLIVGLQTDPTLDRSDSKNSPVQSMFERYLQLKACKFIDEIIVYETEDDLLNLLTSMKIDVRFIGADWEGKTFTGCSLAEEMDIVFNSRQHGYSTSSLRKRVYEAEQNKLKLS